MTACDADREIERLRCELAERKEEASMGALARECLGMARAVWTDNGTAATRLLITVGNALADVALREPAAEVDEPLHARQWREAFERAQDDVAALRAQLADSKQVNDTIRERLADARAQLAAAAPLFEAAHVYHSTQNREHKAFQRRHAGEQVLRCSSNWVRSEAGQRWKAGRE